MPKRRRQRCSNDDESEDEELDDLTDLPAPAPRRAGISAEHLQSGAALPVHMSFAGLCSNASRYACVCQRAAEHPESKLSMQDRSVRRQQVRRSGALLPGAMRSMGTS